MKPDPHIIDKLFKDLVLFTARAAKTWFYLLPEPLSSGYLLTNYCK